MTASRTSCAAVMCFKRQAVNVAAVEKCAGESSSTSPLQLQLPTSIFFFVQRRFSLRKMRLLTLLTVIGAVDGNASNVCGSDEFKFVWEG